MRSFPINNWRLYYESYRNCICGHIVPYLFRIMEIKTNKPKKEYWHRPKGYGKYFGWKIVVNQKTGRVSVKPYKKMR